MKQAARGLPIEQNFFNGILTRQKRNIVGADCAHRAIQGTLPFAALRHIPQRQAAPLNQLPFCRDIGRLHSINCRQNRPKCVARMR